MRIFLACLATFLKNKKMLRLIQFLIVVKTLFYMEKKQEIYLNGQRSTYEILLSVDIFFVLEAIHLNICSLQRAMEKLFQVFHL